MTLDLTRLLSNCFYDSVAKIFIMYSLTNLVIVHLLYDLRMMQCVM